jgi:hypothetical protein
MPVTLPINSNGFCLITVDVIIKDTGTYETSEKRSVVAMIDSGALRCAVSKRLVEELKLKVGSPTSIRGFENQKTNFCSVNLCVPQYSKNQIYPANCVINNSMEGVEFDIILGSDYLQYVRFERNGLNNTFSFFER